MPPLVKLTQTSGRRLFLALATLLISPGTLNADDWPQWLGPTRDGVWHETGILTEFPPGGPALRWSASIGGGYSGPAVAHGRVIVLDRVAEPTTGDEKFLHDGDVPSNSNFVRRLLPGRERVVCLNEADGQTLWVHEYECPYSTATTYAIGPRATATITKDYVYTVGAEGHLFCLQLSDGKVVWSKNYPQDYGVSVPVWGIASPPLVDGDRLICMVGGEGSTCVAFDRHTGRELWRALSSAEPGYSAPVIRNVGTHRQLLCWDSDHLSGLVPETGEVLWQVEFPSTFAMSVATPQVAESRVFVMCFNGKSAMVEVSHDGRSAKIVWTGRRTSGIDGVHNTAQIIDRHLYGCGNGGRYICADLLTGERRWFTFEAVSAARPIPWGNVFTVRNADRCFLSNDRGELIIAELSPQGYKPISKAQLIEPTHNIGSRTLVWSHPAFANKSIYLRNDREIRCYSLSATE